MSPKTIALPLDIYVRVSDTRGRGGESFISPREQEERCRALAKARGYKVGDVFEELDVSGGKMRRPKLDEAIRRIEEGVSGGIIVAKLDRFARTLVGGLQTLEQINELGGAVIVADGEFDTSTATGELVLNMMLSLAQFELRRIRETWVMSKRSAVERGIHITRHSPPGYVRGDDRRLAPDPQKSDVVREAFAMAAAGDRYAQIADVLTRGGIPTSSYRVKRLLENRVYLGEARNGHGDVNTDAHPALVDDITWNLAQRTTAGDTPTLTRSAENLLAGLARCASCSFSMRSQPARGNVIANYRCGCSATVCRCPKPTTIGKDRIEQYVIEQFLEHAGSVTLASVEDGDEAAEAEQAIVEAERSYRSALTDLDLRQQIGDADHAQMVAKLHARWSDLLAAAPVRSRPAAVADAVDLPQIVDDLRADGATRELRDLLGTTIAAVFVRPAVNKARGRPLEERVRVVFHGEEALELPRRGERFEPRRFAW